MSDHLLYEAHGHVRLITLNRPAKMNSLDFEANDALIERWREFDADPEARVAVVTGAGDKAFCAGADLKTYTMEVVHRAHGMPMDEALRLESTSFRNLAHTEDLAEGNAAFRERRPARFTSR